MFEGDKNPKCPDCKNDSIYVVAIWGEYKVIVKGEMKEWKMI